MQVDFTADLDVMFSDFGEEIEKRWTDGDGDHVLIFMGHLLEPTRTVEFAGVQVTSNEWTLQFKTSAVTLTEGDRLTAKGQMFAVNAVSSEDIGVISTAKLRKVI